MRPRPFVVAPVLVVAARLREVLGLSGHGSPGLPGVRREPLEKKEPTP